MKAKKLIACVMCGEQIAFSEMRGHMMDKHLDPFVRNGDDRLPDLEVFTRYFEAVLEPGYYELVQDVKNPKADRRSNAWVAQAVWQKGEHFVALKRTYASTVSVLRKVNRAHDISQVADPERFEALVPHLKRVDDTIPSLYEQYGAYSMHAHVVVAELLTLGKITLDDVRLALKRIDGEGDVMGNSGLFVMDDTKKE